MKISKEVMAPNKKLYKKLNNICTYINIKLDVKDSLTFKANDTNVNFIEPHRFIIKIDSISLV